MDVERKLVEFALRGYALVYSGQTDIVIWFESEKQIPGSKDDWKLYSATVVNGAKQEHVEKSIQKLEIYLEIQRN